MARRDIQSPRVSTSAVVSTAGLSGVIDLAGYRLGAVALSSGWTTGEGLAFLGGHTTGTLYDLWTSTGQVAISSGAMSSGARSFTPVADFAAAIGAYRYLQIRRGVAAASTMAGELTVTLSLVPLRSP